MVAPAGARSLLRRVLTALLVTLLMVGLGGCRLPEAWPLARVWATVTPTIMPSPTTTATPTATSTATPTPTSTPTQTPTPSPTPRPLSVELVLEPAVVSEGHTASVLVRSSEPSDVFVSIGDLAVPMVAVGDGLHAGLYGVGALAGEGIFPVSVTVMSQDGRIAKIGASLVTLAGDFESEALVFEPSTEALLAPDVSQPEAERVAAIFADSELAMLWAQPFQWPREDRLTSLFGTRRTYGTTLASYHAGLDIAGLEGAPVLAAASGTVVLAEPLQVRGNAVIIDHGAGVMSGYFHLSAMHVATGDRVSAGQLIGDVGATGLVTGSHLHWEMRVNGVAVDPIEWLGREFPWQVEAGAGALPAP